MSESLKMPDHNTVQIAGRLTADPELKYTAGGMALCNLRIANTRHFKKKDGSKGEDTCFADVVLWDRQAEWVGEAMKKGWAVLVTGSLQTDQWEDKTTGQKRSKLLIRGQRVVALEWHGSKPGEGQALAPPKPRPIEEPIPEDDIPF